MPIDVSNSHKGTPDGRRTNITTGEVSGIIENQKANEPLGSAEMDGTKAIAKINGMVTGIVYC